MARTAMIRARTDSELKKDVESIFHRLGLSPSDAINLFYHQVRLNQGLPFKVSIPNRKTKRVFDDTDEGKSVIPCSDADDLFESLGI